MLVHSFSPTIPTRIVHPAHVPRLPVSCMKSIPTISGSLPALASGQRDNIIRWRKNERKRLIARRLAISNDERRNRARHIGAQHSDGCDRHGRSNRRTISELTPGHSPRIPAKWSLPAQWIRTSLSARRPSVSLSLSAHVHFDRLFRGSRTAIGLLAKASSVSTPWQKHDETREPVDCSFPPR